MGESRSKRTVNLEKSTFIVIKREDMALEGCACGEFWSDIMWELGSALTDDDQQEAGMGKSTDDPPVYCYPQRMYRLVKCRSESVEWLLYKGGAKTTQHAKGR